MYNKYKKFANDIIKTLYYNPQFTDEERRLVLEFRIKSMLAELRKQSIEVVDYRNILTKDMVQQILSTKTKLN